MAKDPREILRTVNVEGELFSPGDEDELEEALDVLEKADKAKEFKAADEIERLTAKGFIVGFIEMDEEDMTGGNADERVTRLHRRATMQDVVETPKKGKAAKGKAAKGKAAKGAPAEEPETEQVPV